MTRFIIFGPGRAGGALAIGLHRSGHAITAVVGRDTDRAMALAERVGAPALELGGDLPATDILLLAVRDDAIEEVAHLLASSSVQARAAVHVSGLAPVETLRELASVGLMTGSWHPLQALPNPQLGADRLEGSWMAISTHSHELADVLVAVSESLGALPFRLDDELKPLYHAGAAAAANYVTTVLGLAEALAAAAGVPFEAARPLVRAVVDNVFDYGSESALTGPIARGDRSTVAAQLAAIEVHVPHLAEDFRAFGRATARLAGTLETFEDLL